MQEVRTLHGGRSEIWVVGSGEWGLGTED
jgi:hypothetical protein